MIEQRTEASAYMRLATERGLRFHVTVGDHSPILSASEALKRCPSIKITQRLLCSEGVGPASRHRRPPSRCIIVTQSSQILPLPPEKEPPQDILSEYLALSTRPSTVSGSKHSEA